MSIRKLPRIGGRVLKTGIAVALALAVCAALRIPEPVFAGVAATICVQPTVLQTFRKGVQRLQATVIGALIGLVFVGLAGLWPDPYIKSAAAGVAVVIAVWFCLALRWPDALVLAAATVVVIMTHTPDRGDIYVYALERTLVTTVGVIVASLVNGLVIWPRVDDKFPKRLPQITALALEEFEEAVRIFCRRDLNVAKSALDRWKSHSDTFQLAATELSWFQESATVRQMLPLQRTDFAPALAELFFILDSVHKTALELLEDTEDILEQNPKYVLEDAQVYHLIEDTLHTASNLGRAIICAIQSGNLGPLRDAEQNWTTELHKRFISSIRAAHRSPRDIFPLFEVSKVGIELRNYINQLARIRQILLESHEVLDILRKYISIPQSPFLDS